MKQPIQIKETVPNFFLCRTPTLDSHWDSMKQDILSGDYYFKKQSFSISFKNNDVLTMEMFIRSPTSKTSLKYNYASKATYKPKYIREQILNKISSFFKGVDLEQIEDISPVYKMISNNNYDSVEDLDEKDWFEKTINFTIDLTNSNSKLEDYFLIK